MTIQERKKVEYVSFGKGKLHFANLPGFARFILDNKLEDMVKENLRLMRLVDFHLMKQFDFMTEEKIIEISKVSTAEFLSCMIENKLDSFITQFAKKWKENQLPLIAREEIVAEDVPLVSFLRKKSFLSFLPHYTNDLRQSLLIIEELDEYILKRENVSFQTYMEIKQEEANATDANLKKVQAQLLESQELTITGSFEWDLRGRNSLLSPMLFRIFEMEEIENLSSFIKYVHPEDKAKVENAIQVALKGGDIFKCEYRYRKDGDEKILFSQGIVSFEEGIPKIMKGFVRDITENKRTMNRLVASEDRYHSMIKEVQDYAILLLTNEGLVANWNLGAEKIKGYKAEEIIGKYFGLFYLEEDRQNHLPETLIAEAAKMGRATHEGWRRRKDGSVFWGSVVITALHNQKGEITGYSKVTRDLTEKKKAEDELREYATRLEHKNRELELSNKELESFSYVASHDLQEPLRNIKMFSNILVEKERELLSEKGAQLLDRINAATGRMQKLIDDLLAFSQIQPSPAEFEGIDLNEIVMDVKATYNEAIQNGSLIIESDKLPVINGVKFQFSQLFENIIGNAFKYKKADTVSLIKISAEQVKGSSLVKQGADTKKNYVRISIADNGIGFDEKYANRIFELFQRLHGKSEYSGTGIGLAICKKIVYNYDGLIYATGEEGVGSTFFICLPE